MSIFPQPTHIVNPLMLTRLCLPLLPLALLVCLRVVLFYFMAVLIDSCTEGFSI